MSNRPKSFTNRMRCELCGRRNQRIELHAFTGKDRDQQRGALESALCRPCAEHILKRLGQEHLMEHSLGQKVPIHSNRD